MIPISKCTQILNGGDKKYTNDEIKLIRELLTKLALIEFELTKQ